uniref:triose-phosphate isomerase family protein n=1 Tax=uncultured Lentibacter sp. TaxID=1659309 RepID=UPI002631CFA4
LVPFTSSRSVQTRVDADQLQLKYGAQDISQHASGAYTGEVSGTQLKKLGVSYVAVGHSERREYHGESDEVVAAKTKAAFDSGIVPIVCVGEGLDVRKEGNQVEYTLAQVDGALDGDIGDHAGTENERRPDQAEGARHRCPARQLRQAFRQCDRENGERQCVHDVNRRVPGDQHARSRVDECADGVWVDLASSKSQRGQ